MPLWIKTGLYFVAIDIFLWIFLFVAPMFIHVGLDVFIVLFIANPLSIVWAMGGIGGEWETAYLILSGMLFYFLVGTIIGFLSRRTKKHKRQS